MKKFASVAASLLVCSGFLMTASNVMAGPRPKPAANQTVAQGDGPGRDVMASDLPQLTVADLAAARPEIETPRNPNFTPAQYEAAKLAALHNTVGTRPQDAARFMGAPKNPATDVVVNTPGGFTGWLAASQGCNGLGWAPSDMGLAVSATYVVQVVNECLEVYTKAGALVSGFPKDLCGIFGLPANSGTHGCFDPRALYDAQANKFVIITSYQDANGNAFILTAAAANPTAAWHSHKIARGAGLADYPTLGQTAYLNNVNNSIITVCDNFFGATFTDECLFMSKKGVYGALGGIPVWNNFTLGGVIQNTMQPVNSYELSDNPRAQYIINSVNDGGGICNTGGETGLVVWAFSGMTSTQNHGSGAFTGCNSTSFYSLPGSADNATFCSACVETLDNRISAQTFYSQGLIYPSIDTNNGATSAVLGWRVHPYLDDNGGACTGAVLCPNLTAVVIEKEFCIDCGGGNTVESYFGAQGPDPENDWAMFATFSSAGFNLSPGTYYTTNRVSWLTPFHDSGIFACQANNTWSGRWGDYSAVAPDDPGNNVKNIPAVWGSGMYVRAANDWGTCVVGVHPQDGP